MMLCPVAFVLVELLVALLRTPLEEFVEFVFVVKVLPKASFPNSYADLLFLKLLSPTAEAGRE
jgi:hypothetical protein